jgi:hypothetical protein
MPDEPPDLLEAGQEGNMKTRRGVPIPLIVCLLAGCCLGASPVPARLQGDWQMTEGSGSVYRDPGTGTQSVPTINVYAYLILPDGAYHHAALLTSTRSDCTMQIFVFETGVLEVNGDRIVFEDRKARLTSKDNCRPEFNYEKPGKLSRSAFRWRLEQDGDGDVLILRGPDGKEDRYHRKAEDPD